MRLLPVTLSLQTEHAGSLVIVRCAGRVIDGPETAELQQRVGSLFEEHPYVVLDFAGVKFLDSSGLGLLVRLLNRARMSGGDLSICGAAPHIREIFRVTKIDTVLRQYPTAGEAVAASYEHARSAGREGRLVADVLCVVASRDVLAYVHELLRQADVGVLSADNLPDALTLFRATRPKVVVIGSDLPATHAGAASESFNKPGGKCFVIELPSDFSHRDAGDAGIGLLDRIRTLLGNA